MSNACLTPTYAERKDSLGRADRIGLDADCVVVPTSSRRFALHQSAHVLQLSKSAS